MALGVPVSAYLFFNALTALTAEADWTGTSPGTAPQTNYVEGPIALRFSHPCLEDHSSYCINGMCAFHHELDQAICRCYTGYTGERCLNLQSPYNMCSGGKEPL
ncbi:epigen isoform X4 [Fukomys damarensis]|uniref:epigen isoform X4 n=1 Tax=Fukomys damarensis TaxID=885580 RepID=UPI00053F9E91|nr:epigen isoform X4 [Fukomys damarensis]